MALSCLLFTSLKYSKMPEIFEHQEINLPLCVIEGATTHNEKTIEELCCRYQRLVTKVLTEAGK